jgi:serine phosphatase RsbU (regulator of sigma subunit)
MTPDDEEYEERRLIEFLKSTVNAKNPEMINEQLIMDLKKFAAGTSQNDDITILTLQVL